MNTPPEESLVNAIEVDGEDVTIMREPEQVIQAQAAGGKMLFSIPDWMAEEQPSETMRAIMAGVRGHTGRAMGLFIPQESSVFPLNFSIIFKNGFVTIDGKRIDTSINHHTIHIGTELRK